MTAAVAVWAGVLVEPLTAQELEQLERLVERRAEIWRAAQARADSLRRLERFDTVTAGPLTVVTPHAYLAGVQQAAQAVLPRLDSAMTGDTELLAEIIMVGRESAGPVIVMPPPHLGVESSRTVAFFNLREDDDVAQIADRIASAVAQALFSQLSAELQAWAGSPAFFPALRSDRTDLVYQRLATQPSRVARGCFAGNTDQCAAALTLVEVDDPVMVWYDAADRRRLVEDCWACSREPGFGDCLAGSDQACAAVLRDAFVPQPLDLNVRIHLLRTALREGGEGAYRRLAEGPGTSAAERLESVAAMPLDSLLDTWHATVMAASPKPPTMKRAAVWTALVWALAFAAMGFGSTRWR